MQVDNEIEILERKLLIVKENVKLFDLTRGQEKFVLVYLDVVDSYLDKCLDALNYESYREQLREMED
jgi:hypothetical protein